MTPNSPNEAFAKKQIAQIIIGLGIYYGMKLLPEQVDMYVEDLRDLDPNSLREAVIRYRNEPANVFFPRPAQLKGMLEPSGDEIGRDVAARITTALGRFGGEDNNERAKAFIGEVGWEVVKLQGGWIELGKIPNLGDLKILQAQWRELAKTVITKHKLGISQEAPRLPAPDKRIAGLTQMSNILKSPEVPEKSEEEEKSDPAVAQRFFSSFKSPSQTQLANPKTDEEIQREINRQLNAARAAGIL